jgi:PBP1b-binding outer membrane lipoprotein LpoB
MNLGKILALAAIPALLLSGCNKTNQEKTAQEPAPNTKQLTKVRVGYIGLT